MEKWEEPLHLGPMRDSYPTIAHNATHLTHFFPPSLLLLHSEHGRSLVAQGIDRVGERGTG